MAPADVHRTVEAVWRIESPRLIAGIAHLVRDVGLAEELAQDALVAALDQWPRDGVPDNPGAWLTAVAKRRAIDLFRRNERLHDKLATIAGEAASQLQHVDESLSAITEEDVGDDLLRLMFIACHPILSREARVALTLRLLGGLTTEEIARAFLVAETTVAQRIVRAKKTLGDAGIPFELPPPDERAARVSSVLEVVYLIFNEGYAATAGDDWMRLDLCQDAMRLGRVLAGLLPNEPEVHGLVALMEIQASRSRARVGPGGEPVLLLEQDRGRWDHVLIGRGLASLERAERLGGVGPYVLQAQIAACHARARTAEETDWRRIADLYATLATVTPSPVVELNRAVAVSMAEGPGAALPIVEALLGEPPLASYHLLPSVHGDLLAKLGRFDEAAAAFERAASLTQNQAERALLTERAAACARGAAPVR